MKHNTALRWQRPIALAALLLSFLSPGVRAAQNTFSNGVWSGGTPAFGGTLTDIRFNFNGNFDYTAAQGATIMDVSASGGETRTLVVGFDNGTGSYTLRITGGTLTCLSDVTKQATVLVGAGSTTAYAGTAALVVDGGTLLVTGGEMGVLCRGAATASGSFTLNSGAATVDTFAFGNLSASTGTGAINVNGGILNLRRIYTSNTVANSSVNLNGGMLVLVGPELNSKALIESGVGSVNLLAGGAFIDTASFTGRVNKAMGGVGALTKLGAGALILQQNNTYTGNTTNAAGILQIGNAGATGVIVSDEIWNDGLLVINRTGTLVVTNVIRGAGALRQGGSGTIILSNANTFAGPVTNAAGILRAAFNDSLGAGDTVVVGAGRLELADGVTVAGKSLTIAGDGGNFVGALQAVTGGHAVWAGPVIATGSNTRLGAQSNATLEITGPLSGSVPVTFRNEFTTGTSDAGVVVLGGACSLAADFVIASGTVRLAGGNDGLPAAYTVWLGSNTLSGTLDLNGTSPSAAGLGVWANSSGVQTVGNSSTTSDAILTLGAGGGLNTTNTFTGSIVDSLAGGTRKVGLTLAGGQATFTSANTYSGPTVVNAGRLVVSAAHSGGGAFTVADAAGLAVNVSAAGQSLQASALEFNGGNTTNDFVLSAPGNPTAPIIRAASLVINGTVHVNFTGLGLAVGSIQLVDYDTLGGAGEIVIASLPAGVEAHIETNLVTTSIDLVVDQVPSLVWLGQTNGVPAAGWDIGQTTNWFDRAQSQPGFFLDNLDVVFDDSVTNGGGSTLVALATNVRPFTLVVSNNAVDYTFSNAGANFSIGGNARLVKDGAAMLTLATSNNTFSGYTLLKAGTLKLGATSALPAVPLTNAATLDLGGFAASVGGLTGGGLITNSAETAVTNRLSVGNGNTSGDFTGRIEDGVSGKVELAKAGTGTQVLHNPANTYSGGTLVSGGALQLGAENVAGTGPVTLAGGALSSDGAQSRTVTNALTISANSTLGGTNQPGLLTLNGPLDFAGGNRNLTVHSPTLFSGPSHVAAGGLSFKLGAADFTLLSNVVTWISPVEVQAGTMVVDGATWTNSGSVRTVAVTPNGTARLVLTNGASLVITSAVAVLRAGNSSGNSTGTNIFDLAGSLLFPSPGAASTDGKVLIGNTCNRGVINLLAGGVLMTRAVQRDATGGGTHDAEFNFDGGTLMPSPGAVGATFFQGLTEAKVRAGGAVIDTASQNLTIAQSLLEDPASTGGGLTKLGGGALVLNGTNTFTGPTAVNAGTLGGTGVVSGTLTIAPAATLAPGAGIGALTVGANPQLGGTTIMEINPAATPNADRLVVSGALNFGGALVVTNLGGDPAPGTVFDLFDATSFGGAFSSIILPALPAGREWDTNSLAVDGTLSVIALAPPVVANFAAETESGQALVLSAVKVLARCTSPDGLALTLAEVSATSTNGGEVEMEEGIITYTPAEGFTGTDAFSYTVRDTRGLQATAWITVTVKAAGGQSQNLVSLLKSGSEATLQFAGIPGREYVVQTTTNGLPTTNWWNVSTNTAGTNGLWNFTDPAATNTVQFYRVRER